MRVKKCLLQNEMKVVLRQATRKIEDTTRKKKKVKMVIHGII